MNTVNRQTWGILDSFGNINRHVIFSKCFYLKMGLSSLHNNIELRFVCLAAPIIYIHPLAGTNSSLKSHVVLLQTAHSCANAGVLLGES